MPLSNAKTWNQSFWKIQIVTSGDKEMGIMKRQKVQMSNLTIKYDFLRFIFKMPMQYFYFQLMDRHNLETKI